MDRNPELAHALNDPALLRQSLEARGRSSLPSSWLAFVASS